MTAERPSQAPIGRPGPAWRGDGALSPRRVHPAHRPVPADEAGEAPIPLEGARLATFRQRSVGAAIDLLIIFAGALITQMLAGLPSTAESGQMLSLTLMFVGYHSIFGALGWSPGKRLRGLRIVTADGQAPGAGRGVTRALVGFLGAFIVPFALGYLWAIWDGKRQTWHDKVAGTYVVIVEDDEAEVRASR